MGLGGMSALILGAIAGGWLATSVGVGLVVGRVIRFGTRSPSPGPNQSPGHQTVIEKEVY